MHNSTPLSALRNLLLAQGLDGMIVPRADAHQSEDCTPHDNKLAWLTGFSGSAGLALVLRDRALMFVDGRYQVQVRNEVSLDDFEIHHLHDEPLANYLQSHVAAGARIGFEPLLMVNSQFEALSATHCELVPLEQDPFDQVWLDRPAAPCGIIHEMPIEISGESSTQKRARVVALLTQQQADVLAITLPDNIAWLLNVRGSDLPMVPVPFSFALLHRSGELEWFVDSNKTQQLPAALLNTLTQAPQESFLARCQQLAKGKRFLVDKDYAPVALRFAIVEHGGEVLWAPDPITLMKAHKNDVELAGYRECHEQDGAAWVNFLAWLTHEVPLREAAGNPVTELEAQARQLEFRQQQPGFIEQSFNTISASASNAAMCHYHSSEKTNTPITSQAMYLNDSGGQYHNGTTDTTRTLAFGPQDPQRRLHYTAVLKGFLSLISLQFPSGTQGHQLDAFSRRALWDLGLDFDHGTGHGVGHQLLIHEQPHRIAKKVNPWPLVAGNIITIEPGYYLAGEYGIRIENQVEIINSRPGFCRFSTLTLVPIDLSLVELHLLSEAEKQWIDDYHQQVRETLSPRVNAEARPWLFAATAPIRVQAN
ncbi:MULTISPECIES: aminopeptidase P family protein [unclassified Citrobacter]|uniref:aminopeptidase P family protein n=1 Tax=unclassified Citrobacter TaxID=2644389 RepID=UPI0015E59827|nr:MULTISPECIES: aminopeptidase P family protein [unclassified Citrobacter]EGT0677004.1 aminopeptidase P family protein [Citrobacter braakii]EHG7890869.1 aminopeptidase P family protein [Citrobacter braakii]MDU2847191.1 aminopeptidase P family protein [Citrobacter sp.]QLO84994.1 aminopeptidase P family protein [Citrobacter sp. RHBSTW-00944]QLX39503.1 aminopeptidase P family protein [Citrobacter sp. RHBSTW-00229]